MDTTRTYAIYSTAFHGGGAEGSPYNATGYLISQHRSEAAAIRKYRSWSRGHGDCRCGAPILMVDFGGVTRKGHPFDDRIVFWD